MNYKHLHYFWRVAKSGGVARASEELHLTPQTISGQIGMLEEALGVPLFAKRGRNLELTDAGRLAFGYAEDIFAQGAELEESLRTYAAGGRPVESDEITEEFFAISVERRVTHPCVAAITAAARDRLFASRRPG